MATKYLILLITFLTAVLSISCEREAVNMDEVEPYSGPWLISFNTITYYSDSAIVRVKITSDTQVQFENGDAEYPDGLFLIFYEKDGTQSSTLTANKGYFNKKEALYTVEDDVVINSQVKKQILNTELLNWLPNERRIYTDRFVTIETDDEILKGHGLEAPEDFSTYRILRPTGSFAVNN
jgi:LPS export ABC transporter protein LptC